MRSTPIFLAAIGLSSSLFAETPTTFTLKGDRLVTPSGQIFVISEALGGRGQAGLANFYSDGRNEYLIKEDDPATCLLEGSAQFVREAGILPKALETAVNFASAGSIKRNADDKMPLVVSIQDKVNSTVPGAQISPWDNVVYGQKRDPKTISSFESKYPQAIIDNIAGMRPYARWRLAAAILASNLAGDESLHVGQFMAALDSNRNVLDVVRIDLGARERFAVARNKLNQLSPFHASSLYQKSGQFNKDYISYLLAESNLIRSYSMLWFRIFGQKERILKALKEASARVFLAQLNNIPNELQKSAAVKEVIDTINKGGDAKNPASVGTIPSLDESRAKAMIDAGAKYYKGLLPTAQLVEGLSSSERTEVVNTMVMSDKLVKGETPSEEATILMVKLRAKAFDLAAEAVKKPSKAVFEKLVVYGKVGLFFADAFYLSSELIDGAEDAVRMFQSITDVATSCVNAKSNDRKISGAILIQGLIGGIKELKVALLDKKRMTDFTLDKGLIKNSPNKEGERIVKLIRSRYLLPAK